MITVSPLILAALRTTVQGAWAWLVGQLAILSWLPAPLVVDFIVTSVILAGVTLALRWLETRKGDDVWSRLARLVAKWAMLGLGGKQPVYVSPK